MRVEVLLRNDMSQSDFHPCSYIFEGLIRPFGLRVSAILGRDDAPVVVGVGVRVQCDLLLYVCLD